jgi:phasin family protein
LTVTALNTPEQIAAANKANVETLQNVASATLASLERLTALNLNTARAILDESLAHAKVLLGAKDIQELIRLQTSVVQPAAEKSVAYARSVYEIVTLSQKGLTDVVEDQFAELNKSLSTALDQATKNAPAGSDVAVAAVKSAIAAANSAYESVTKATKQLAEMTEANVNAAANASVKAVGSATAATKGKKSA